MATETVAPLSRQAALVRLVIACIVCVLSVCFVGAICMSECIYECTLYSAAIKQKMDVIEWDSPQQALLSLASLVERHMGGTSGAVSLHIYTCTYYIDA